MLFVKEQHPGFVFNFAYIRQTLEVESQVIGTFTE